MASEQRADQYNPVISTSMAVALIDLNSQRVAALDRHSCGREILHPIVRQQIALDLQTSLVELARWSDTQDGPRRHADALEMEDRVQAGAAALAARSLDQKAVRARGREREAAAAAAAPPAAAAAAAAAAPPAAASSRSEGVSAAPGGEWAAHLADDGHGQGASLGVFATEEAAAEAVQNAKRGVGSASAEQDGVMALAAIAAGAQRVASSRAPPKGAGTGKVPEYGDEPAAPEAKTRSGRVSKRRRH